MLRRLILATALVGTLTACQWPFPPQGETVYETEPNNKLSDDGVIAFPLAPDRFAGEVGGEGDSSDIWERSIPSGNTGSYAVSCQGTGFVVEVGPDGVGCGETWEAVSVPPAARLSVRPTNWDMPHPYTITITYTPTPTP